MKVKVTEAVPTYQDTEFAWNHSHVTVNILMLLMLVHLNLEQNRCTLLQNVKIAFAAKDMSIYAMVRHVKN